MTEMHLPVHVQAPRRGTAWIAALVGLLVLALAAGLMVVAVRSLNPTGPATDIKPARADQLTAKARPYVADEGFRAVFPTHPQRIVENIPIDGLSFKTVTYAAETDKMVAGVVVIELPRLGGYDMVKGAQGIADHMGAKLLDTSPARHQGNDALTYKLRTQDDTLAQGLLVRARRHVYLAIIEADKNTAGRYRAFVKDFRIRAVR